MMQSEKSLKNKNMKKKRKENRNVALPYLKLVLVGNISHEANQDNTEVNLGQKDLGTVIFTSVLSAFCSLNADMLYLFRKKKKKWEPWTHIPIVLPEEKSYQYL